MNRHTLLAAGLLGLVVATPAGAEVRPGKPAAAFDLPTLDGKRLSLAALKGKIVLLDFWASWCAPCKEELPELERLRREYEVKGVAIVTINIDERRDNAAALAKRLGLTLPVGLDDGGKVAEQYEPPTMPTSFLIGRDGVTRAMHSGYRTGDVAKLKQELDELLKK